VDCVLYLDIFVCASSDTASNEVALVPLRTGILEFDGGGKVCRPEELESLFRQFRPSKGFVFYPVCLR
jgi:hypothetical protein